MAISPRQFIEALSDCGLLNADEASALARELAADDAPGPDAAAVVTAVAAPPGASAGGEAEIDERTQQIARQLIADGRLTRFQVRAVLGGAGKGLRIGDYVVLEKLGAGGMGAVYKARHRVMKRIVALKILPRAATQNPRLVQRFYREVEVAARLIHPNIVTAYDAGEYNGAHYLVSEFVDGMDLSALIKQHGPLQLSRALDYTIQAARGLAYAHEHGVIHRDVKPGNLLLAPDGVVKVLDMGLARFTEADEHADEASLTVTGRLMGTVEYMAPEHAANPKNADHRSDIYSLGCTLYRLLTGKLPFRGETAVETIIAQREQPVPRLADALPDAPAALQRVFERMLAKSPAGRFATMAETADALEAAARGVEHDAQAPFPQHLIGELAAASSGMHEAISDPPPVARPRTVPPAPLYVQQSRSGSIGTIIAVLGAIAAAVAVVALMWALLNEGSEPEATPAPSPIASVGGPGLEPIPSPPPAPTGPSTDTTDLSEPPPPQAPTPSPTPPTTEPVTTPSIEDGWRSMFNGETLDNWAPIERLDLLTRRPGVVEVDGRHIALRAGDPITGISWVGGFPTTGYELTLEARLEGGDLFNVSFPVGDDRAAFQLNLAERRAGLHLLDGVTLRDRMDTQPTTAAGGLWQMVRIRVGRQRLQVFLNEKLIDDHELATHRFGAPAGYEPMRPLSIFAADGEAFVRNIRVRELPAEPAVASGESTTTTGEAAPEPRVILPSDAWHALLGEIDAARDSRVSPTGGTAWSMRDDTLIARSNSPMDVQRSVLLVPAQLQGGYELSMSFDVVAGGGPIVLTLPADGERITLILDGPSGTGFMPRRRVGGAAAQMVDQRLTPNGGPYTLQLAVRTFDDRVTAQAKIGPRTVPSYTAARAAAAGPVGERIRDRLRAAAAGGVGLRVGDRQIEITQLDVRVLPGGRAVLMPVAADDAGNETIEMPAPPQLPREDGTQPPTRPGDARPTPPSRPPPPRRD